MSRHALAAAIVISIANSPLALAQKVEWVPVGADVAHTINGNEIVITAGTVVNTIELEVRVSDWGAGPKKCTNDRTLCSVDGDCTDGGTCDEPLLNVAFAALDAGTLAGSLSTVPTATDLVQVGFSQTLMTCRELPFAIEDDTGIPCDTEPCASGTFCFDSPNWLFFGISYIAASSDGTANTQFAGASTSTDPCGIDDPPVGNGYLGTLLLAEQTGTAKGTYTIGFDPRTAYTFLNDCTGTLIAGLVRTPALITFETVACCSVEGDPPVATCVDDVLPADCTSPSLAAPGEKCADIDCEICTSDADCFVDFCYIPVCGTDPPLCQDPIPVYDTASECCDGSVNPPIINPLDDGDPCTSDACSSIGIPVHSPTGAEGTPCDDGTTCTYDDQCDGVNSTPDGGCSGTDVNGQVCSSDFICQALVPQAVCDVDASQCACSEFPIIAAQIPHQRPKNRYISFSPSPNYAAPVDIAVQLTASSRFPSSVGHLGWVGTPDANGVARIVANPVTRVWSEPVVHVGDCGIVPAATYELLATLAPDPLVITTAEAFANASWADCVGAFGYYCAESLDCCDPNAECPGAVCPPGDTCIAQWLPGEGTTNFNDVQAAIRKFQELENAPDTTWVDLHGAEGATQDPYFDPPNYVINFSDVQQIIKAFQGEDYPYAAPADCP